MKGTYYIVLKKSFRRGAGVKHPFANWNALKPELDAIIARLGHFPSDGELAQLGRYDVRNAIRDHHGGFLKAQQKMGLVPKKKTGALSLAIWENFSSDVAAIVQKLGRFPTRIDFERLNRIDVWAHMKTHGGVDAVRKRMGFALGQKKGVRSLKHWTNFEQELRGVWQALGHYPTWIELEEFGRDDILGSFRYHGGANKVRKKLGVPLVLKSGEYTLRKWPNLRAELIGIIREHGRFPSYQQLVAMGRSDIARAIIIFPGGTNAVRRKFGLKPLKRPPPESFRSWQNARQQLQIVFDVFGHFSTEAELVATGNASLLQAIRDYHGGLRSAKARFLGLKEKPTAKRIRVTAKERRLFLNAKRGGGKEKLLLIDRLEPIIRRAIRIELHTIGYRESPEDLHQQAIVGLLSSLERNSTPDQFFGGIGRVIRGELKRLVRRESGFHFPRKEFYQITVIAQVAARLRVSLGREPSAEEIAQATTISIPQIISLKKRYPRSLFQTDKKGHPLIARIRQKNP